MQTNLPDLPFIHGNLTVGPTHSSASSTPRAYPRTDLQTLRAWESFPYEIHVAIQSATTSAHLSSAPFHIEAFTGAEEVEDEEGIRAHAKYALHRPVREVLQKLGVNGKFISPTSGHAAIVGSPDCSWIVGHELQAHPKLIIEYKTWWAVDLEDIFAVSIGTRNLNTLRSKTLYALQQVYGYMTFNNNKFGILTNWKHTLFLRRTEVDGRHTLDAYAIELDGNQHISMLKAWVGMVLLAEADWSYASPTLSSPPPNQTFGPSATAQASLRRAVDNAQGYHMQPINGNYQCRTLRFHLCHFDLSTARQGQHGCVVETRLVLAPTPTILPSSTRKVICKVVDATRYPDAVELLNAEVRAYAALIDLQGNVIPRLYGFYRVWGILQLIALQPVGESIAQSETIDQQLRKKMRKALRCIHNAGYVHGDVARRNFCRTRSGRIFLVDLESCRSTANQAEFRAEMNIVNGL